MSEREPHSTVAKVREELQQLAREDGLRPGKLEGTTLLSLAILPTKKSIDATISALFSLIEKLVAELPGDKVREAARATLNLARSPVQGRAAMARQAELARLRGVHPDTVRAWWSKAAGNLAEVLVRRLADLSANPDRWELYLAHDDGASFGETEEPPGYSFERVDIAWRMTGRIATELLTYRWLVAEVEGLDRIEAVGWYYADLGKGSCEVVPLLNCEKLSTRHVGRGIHLSELAFPNPLRRHEPVFFAYTVRIHSEQETVPIFMHTVRSGGVGLLNFRIQFDVAALPVRIWKFASSNNAEQLIPPPRGSDREARVNRLGYVEARFAHCKPGLSYGLSWSWGEG